MSDVVTVVDEVIEVVTVVDEVIEVVTVAEQGPPGIPGEDFTWASRLDIDHDPILYAGEAAP